MKKNSALFLYVLLLISITAFGQDEPKKPKKKKSKFQTGLYLGSYFSNKQTAVLYDGYGYDLEGNRNDFSSSFMYRKVVLEYGGGYGQTDQVAAALGVNHGEWTFDETDMPMAMKYIPSFSIGLNMNYTPNKKDAWFLNLNAARLLARGNFTIVITTPPIGPQPPGYQNIQTFGIAGSEQRLLCQAGYRRIFIGEEPVFNMFLEGGIAMNMTKYMGNQAVVNGLRMDLASFYYQQYYPTYNASYLKGIGLGAFAGLGLNIAANDNWTLQFLYQPSFEKINIGVETKPALHHSIGLRTFYTL